MNVKQDTGMFGQIFPKVLLLDVSILKHGVMVALGILVFLVQVRILVFQQKMVGSFKD